MSTINSYVAEMTKNGVRPDEILYIPLIDYLQPEYIRVKDFLQGKGQIITQRDPDVVLRNKWNLC